MVTSITVTILNRDLEISCRPAFSLLNNFLINDAPIHTTCGGHANCGCCRIKVLEKSRGLTPPNEREKRRLGEYLISQGWRLSCQTHSLGDLVVHMPTENELDSECSKK
jgi:ferredoxin